jgi:hypothetical protein
MHPGCLGSLLHDLAAVFRLQPRYDPKDWSLKGEWPMNAHALDRAWCWPMRLTTELTRGLAKVRGRVVVEQRHTSPLYIVC